MEVPVDLPKALPSPALGSTPILLVVQIYASNHSVFSIP